MKRISLKIPVNGYSNVLDPSDPRPLNDVLNVSNLKKGKRSRIKFGAEPRR